MNGDDSSSARVDDGPTSLISFAMIAEPPASEKYIGNALIDKGAEAPKSCLSPGEMRTKASAGGLLPAGTASTVMRAIFPRPFFSWSLGEDTKERTGQTKFNQLAPLSWRTVIQIKSTQTLVIDPGGCSGHLPTRLPVSGRAMRVAWGRGSFERRMISEAGTCFCWTEDLNIIFKRRQAIRYAVRVL